MIASCLPALTVHALLDDHPLAGIGHHEPVQIEIEAVLHGGAVHLGNEPARRGERGSIGPDAIADPDQLVRASRKSASASFPSSPRSTSIESTSAKFAALISASG